MAIKAAALLLLSHATLTAAFGINIWEAQHATEKPTRAKPSRATIIKTKTRCVNEKKWTSKWNSTCADYKKNAYCTVNGTAGTGWKLAEWGAFESNANNAGINATTACCACGGGTDITKITKGQNMIYNQTCKYNASQPFKTFAAALQRCVWRGKKSKRPCGGIFVKSATCDAFTSDEFFPCATNNTHSYKPSTEGCLLVGKASDALAELKDALAAQMQKQSAAEAMNSTWKKVKKKQCASNHRLNNTAYSTLGKAKRACAMNAKCGGVSQTGCKKTGSMYLCKKEKTKKGQPKAVMMTGAATSCVYAKPGHHGHSNTAQGKQGKNGFVSMGVDNCCRLTANMSLDKGYNHIVPNVDEAGCKAACLIDHNCVAMETREDGVTNNSKFGTGSRCEIWYQLPMFKKAVPGYECWINKPVASRNTQFKKAMNNGLKTYKSMGNNTVCRLTANMSDQFGWDHVKAEHGINECYAACTMDKNCVAAEHRAITGNCEIWYQMPILSKSLAGYECFINQARSGSKNPTPFTRAMKGKGYTEEAGACIASNETIVGSGISAYFSNQFTLNGAAGTANTLKRNHKTNECKAACTVDKNCKGVETKPDNWDMAGAYGCELFYDTPTGATAKAGHTCWTQKKPKCRDTVTGKADQYGTCAKYKSAGWCIKGKTGKNWLPSWGRLSQTVKDHCCACGGGSSKSIKGGKGGSIPTGAQFAFSLTNVDASLIEVAGKAPKNECFAPVTINSLKKLGLKQYAWVAQSGLDNTANAKAGVYVYKGTKNGQAVHQYTKIGVVPVNTAGALKFGFARPFMKRFKTFKALKANKFKAGSGAAIIQGNIKCTQAAISLDKAPWNTYKYFAWVPQTGPCGAFVYEKKDGGLVAHKCLGGKVVQGDHPTVN